MYGREDTMDSQPITIIGTALVDSEYVSDATVFQVWRQIRRGWGIYITKADIKAVITEYVKLTEDDDEDDIQELGADPIDYLM